MTLAQARQEDLGRRRTEWECRDATADIDGRVGNHDRYSVLLTAPGEEPPPGLRARAHDALMRYQIYPPRRMMALVCSPDHRVGSGVLIIQRIIVGIAAVEAAVRVMRVFGSGAPGETAGFSYVTLEGHTESGNATFWLSEHAAAGLTFNIETWSRPAGWQGRLSAPVARLLQKRFSGEALESFRLNALASNAKVDLP
jgi:uncharacterized protein (UPF0548 family)